MTPPSEKHVAPHPEHPQEFDLERVRQLVTDLEQDLANAPSDIPNLQDLRTELDEFKQALFSPKPSHGTARKRLHAIRTMLQKMSATVEGELLADSPYIAEAGRILGMV